MERKIYLVSDHIIECHPKFKAELIAAMIKYSANNFDLPAITSILSGIISILTKGAKDKQESQFDSIPTKIRSSTNIANVLIHRSSSVIEKLLENDLIQLLDGGFKEIKITDQYSSGPNTQKTGSILMVTTVGAQQGASTDDGIMEAAASAQPALTDHDVPVLKNPGIMDLLKIMDSSPEGFKEGIDFLNALVNTSIAASP